jgi:hypothetical protein
METPPDSAINAALRSFEASEANLDKLDRLFRELRALIPDGINFGSDAKYEELCRSYADVLEVLPKIDGWKPTSMPIDLNDLAQWRLDAAEIGEISASVSADEAVDAPVRELSDYRHRLARKRRILIRGVLPDLIDRADTLIRQLYDKYRNAADTAVAVVEPALDDLRESIQAIDTLLGSSLPRPGRWSDLRRHLTFGRTVDLLDLVRLDWPRVKSDLSAGLYAQNEPIPVEVDDLGALADARPRGAVATKLKWDSLSAEDFERLLFALIGAAKGYENPEWLTNTNAPDRGRDLSVARVTSDPLAGVTRRRVHIQCRHWGVKSISVTDVAGLKEQVKLWEPPRVDVLVIATSGRFTSDAVAAIEKHNQDDRALKIEMWPESHLERLLAERPALIAEFHLR